MGNSIQVSAQITDFDGMNFFLFKFDDKELWFYCSSFKILFFSQLINDEISVGICNFSPQTCDTDHKNDE